MAVHTRNHPAVVRLRSAAMGLAKVSSNKNGYSQVEMKDLDEEVRWLLACLCSHFWKGECHYWPEIVTLPNIFVRETPCKVLKHGSPDSLLHVVRTGQKVLQPSLHRNALFPIAPSNIVLLKRVGEIRKLEVSRSLPFQHVHTGLILDPIYWYWVVPICCPLLVLVRSAAGSKSWLHGWGLFKALLGWEPLEQ